MAPTLGWIIGTLTGDAAKIGLLKLMAAANVVGPLP